MNIFHDYRVTIKCFTCILILLSVIFFYGCAGNQTTKTDPTVIFENKEYCVGPEDVLKVEIWNEPDLTRDVTVQPDGKISLPLINEVKVDGLTVQEMNSLLGKKFEKFIDIPSVTVTVVDPKSYKIYVMGNVRTPGMVQPKSEITFLQAISLAGGFSEWADKKNILLKRYEKGAERTININYDHIVSGTKPTMNIIMRSGDTIVVP
jgi:polysaccharide export outer membrane protein